MSRCYDPSGVKPVMGTPLQCIPGEIFTRRMSMTVRFKQPRAGRRRLSWFYVFAGSWVVGSAYEFGSEKEKLSIKNVV